MQSDVAPARGWRQAAGWIRSLASATLVATLLGLGLANIALRATWNEVEDGILWVAGPNGVSAAEVAPGGPGDDAGVKSGDILLAIESRPVEKPADIVSILHTSQNGERIASPPTPQDRRAPRVHDLPPAEPRDPRDHARAAVAWEHRALLRACGGRHLHAD